MSSKWRRFEVLLPLHRNDGTEIPESVLGEAVFAILDHFTGVQFDRLSTVGHWLHGGQVYRDNLARLIVDVRDTLKNRKWMREFKANWTKRLDQIELWMVSYRIDVE